MLARIRGVAVVLLWLLRRAHCGRRSMQGKAAKVGVYHLTFYFDGVRQGVIVDDTLPCDDRGCLVFSRLRRGAFADGVLLGCMGSTAFAGVLLSSTGSAELISLGCLQQMSVLASRPV